MANLIESVRNSFQVLWSDEGAFLSLVRDCAPTGRKGGTQTGADGRIKSNEQREIDGQNYADSRKIVLSRRIGTDAKFHG